MARPPGTVKQAVGLSGRSVHSSTSIQSIFVRRTIAQTANIAMGGSTGTRYRNEPTDIA
jgi:hypothetical protein